MAEVWPPKPRWEEIRDGLFTDFPWGARFDAACKRIAELEAENTPPEGYEGWKRSHVLIGPPDQRGDCDVRLASGKEFRIPAEDAETAHGVTFP